MTAYIHKFLNNSPVGRPIQKNPDQVLNFVRKIGAEGIKKYESIDEIFVPPVEYDDIKKALTEDKIVFITVIRNTVDLHCNKTTWDYFNKEYEPIWLKGQNSQERLETRSSLSNVEKYMKPHHIVYFEDPFGKTRYDPLIEDEITRNISSIIDIIKNTEDTYVIITSRDEVFKDFERRVIAQIDLTQFQKQLIIKTPSYGEEKRKEMLLNWANLLNCRWLQDDHLVNMVLEKIKYEDKLPTSLNIEQFAYGTIDVFEEEELLEKIEAKSKETAELCRRN